MRVRVVDGKNQDIYPAKEGRYYLTLGLGRFTGAVTTGAVFAMRNGTSKLITVHRMVLQGGFSGAGAAASTQIIQIKRFSAATHTGGTSILANVVKNSTTMAASTLLDARTADISGTSPLTDTSVVYEAPCRNSMIPRSLSGMSDLQWFSDRHPELVLQPSEGLAIFLANTAVVGDNIVGLICWEEVTLGAGNIGGPT
mgnify:CR=1 FL=1